MTSSVAFSRHFRRFYRFCGICPFFYPFGDNFLGHFGHILWLHVLKEWLPSSADAGCDVWVKLGAGRPHTPLSNKTQKEAQGLGLGRLRVYCNARLNGASM